jgi:hypothetical protein
MADDSEGIARNPEGTRGDPKGMADHPEGTADDSEGTRGRSEGMRNDSAGMRNDSEASVSCIITGICSGEGGGKGWITGSFDDARKNRAKRCIRFNRPILSSDL